MNHNLPVWLKDQHGHEYQVQMDVERRPYIDMREQRGMLSMKDVIDKPPGHVVHWGQWDFTVIKNVLHFGIGDE